MCKPLKELRVARTNETFYALRGLGYEDLFMTAKLVPFLLALALGTALGYGVSRSLHPVGSPELSPTEPPASGLNAWDAESNPLDLSLAEIRADDARAANSEPSLGPPAARQKLPTMDEVQAGLRALVDAPAGADTDRRERALVERWAELDPAGAAAYAAEAFKQGGSERLLRHTAEAYAKKDPTAASAWAASLDSPMARDAALRQIYRTWSENDPGAAASSISSLPVGSAQTVAASTVGARFADRNLPAALQWVGQL